MLEVVGVAPLGDDQEVHPSEENGKHHNLGNELEKEVQGLGEVDCIQSLHDNTERHLEDSEDDSDLHLDAVGHVQVVGALLPSGVESEFIDTVVGDSVVANLGVGVGRVV